MMLLLSSLSLLTSPYLKPRLGDGVWPIVLLVRLFGGKII